MSAQLVSLDSVNITWRIPSDNTSSIISYTLTICTRILPNDTDCSNGTLFNVSVLVNDLTMISGNRLSYILPELTTQKEYEVVIRARNLVGLQMSPALGGGFKFNSAFPDNGRVVDASFIPATTMLVIVTWNLPALAIATDNLNVSFIVTYYSDGDPDNTRMETVPRQPDLQGVSVNLTMPDSPVHTFQIVANYGNPNLLSSPVTLTDVQTLANGTKITKNQHMYSDLYIGWSYM